MSSASGLPTPNTTWVRPSQRPQRDIRLADSSPGGKGSPLRSAGALYAPHVMAPRVADDLPLRPRRCAPGCYATARRARTDRPTDGRRTAYLRRRSLGRVDAWSSAADRQPSHVWYLQAELEQAGSSSRLRRRDKPYASPVIGAGRLGPAWHTCASPSSERGAWELPWHSPCATRGPILPASTAPRTQAAPGPRACCGCNRPSASTNWSPPGRLSTSWPCPIAPRGRRRRVGSPALPVPARAWSPAGTRRRHHEPPGPWCRTPAAPPRWPCSQPVSGRARPRWSSIPCRPSAIPSAAAGASPAPPSPSRRHPERSAPSRRDSVSPSPGLWAPGPSFSPTTSGALYHAAADAGLQLPGHPGASGASTSSSSRDCPPTRPSPCSSLWSQATLENVRAQGTVEALTGPLSRGDDAHRRGHLAALAARRPPPAAALPAARPSHSRPRPRPRRSDDLATLTHNGWPRPYWDH